MTSLFTRLATAARSSRVQRETRMSAPETSRQPKADAWRDLAFGIVIR